MKRLAVYAVTGVVLVLMREPIGFWPGSGILTFLWLLAAIIWGYFLSAHVPAAMGKLFGHRTRQQCLMLALSIWLVLFGLQVALSVYDRFFAEQATAKSTIPPELDRIPLPRPPGCVEAYLWHGHEHYFFSEGFRRTVPLEPKRPGSLRIVFLGDSLTYAQGVAERGSYVRILEGALGEVSAAKGRALDVVNLGVCGANSPDILKYVYRYFSLLQPDLAVYGMCLNDLVDRPESANNRRWKLPIPERFNQWMWHRTRAWRWMASQYDGLLMNLGIRDDFFADILRDWDGYSARFVEDLRGMNEHAIGRGMPPVVFMVVSQTPMTKGRGWDIAMRAEDLARAAGMEVISCAVYFKEYDGVVMKVSPWEGHPNEEAHRLFARELEPVLRDKIAGAAD